MSIESAHCDSHIIATVGETIAIVSSLCDANFSCSAETAIAPIALLDANDGFDEIAQTAHHDAIARNVLLGDS